MFIVDLSQVMYSSIMTELEYDTSKVSELNEDKLRHMILNCLRSYNLKYRKEYETMIIATDSTSWRKEYFPYYKANRKKAREQSQHDWENIFEIMNKIRDEIKEFTPYPVIHITGAEADDIIASLIKYCHNENCLILSGDKDFKQLHSYRIKQYDPTRKKWLVVDNPSDFLLEHIIRGDSGDGIPNVLSNDNCLVIGERQKPITVKRLESFKNEESRKNLLTNPLLEHNWNRNKKLIDLSETPEEIQDAIIKDFLSQLNKDRSRLLSYFMSNKLRILTEHISEF